MERCPGLAASKCGGYKRNSLGTEKRVGLHHALCLLSVGVRALAVPCPEGVSAFGNLTLC